MTGEIELVRHPRARRARLAVDPRTGSIRLTIPSRASAAKALAWAQEQRAWIASQQALLPTPQPFCPGASIPFEDGTLRIDWHPGPARSIRREGDRLLVEGSEEALPRRVERWLRAEALRTLSEDTLHYAAKAGVSIARVQVGDAKGRWGSCSSNGAIRYSWRLICAPRAVRRATAAHEVAHRIHMNHGPAFHVLVDNLFEGDTAQARNWLRLHGATLHWIGREA